MSKTTNESEAARTEALKRTIEANAGMPAASMARGGRTPEEESARFIESAHETAQPKK
jgi:hypothetical protein